MLAAGNGGTDVMEELMGRGADVNAQNVVRGIADSGVGGGSVVEMGMCSSGVGEERQWDRDIVRRGRGRRKSRGEEMEI